MEETEEKIVDYEEAAKKKNDLLLETDDLDVKIKKVNLGNKNFVVKTRKSNKNEA